MLRLLILSGPICAGKSELVERLRGDGFASLSTSECLREVAQSRSLSVDRKALQDLSRQIDMDTNYSWIAKALSEKNFKEESLVVVDSVRFPEQVAKIREKFGWRTIHVHLTAPREVLRVRFEQRSAAKDRKVSFDEAIGDLTEQNEDSLSKEADLLIDTSRCDADDIYIRVAARLGLFAPPAQKFVDVLVGGQYGSEGKGQVAAYLAREYDVVVRVGGPNAGHRVSSESGVFTYIHLPSGCRDHDAEILLGPGTIINTEQLLQEISDAGVNPARITIDENCFLITDEDIAAETKLKQSISSTGQGVGAATARKIWRGDNGAITLAKGHPALKPMVGSVIDRLERAYATGKRIFLEGTQGSGLSLHHGAFPYVTSRDTNVAGCLSEAGISPMRVRKVLMVLRPYPIRVGNPEEPGKTSGPLKNEIGGKLIAERAALDAEKLLSSEVTSRTKRPRRFGEFDWTLFRRSCALNAPTDIAFTFADYISIKNRDAYRFEQLTPETIRFVEELERVAQAPVSLINTKFDQRSVIDRRNWGVGRRLWRT